MGFPGDLDGKSSAWNEGDLGSIPGLRRFPGGNPLQYSCLQNPQGQRSLVGYSPWDCIESDTTEWLSNNIYHVQYICIIYYILIACAIYDTLMYVLMPITYTCYMIYLHSLFYLMHSTFYPLTPYFHIACLLFLLLTGNQWFILYNHASFCCYIHWFVLCFRFSILVISYSICLSLPDLFHLT